MFEADDSVFLHSDDRDMAREFLLEPGLITEEYLETSAQAMRIWGCYTSIKAENWDYEHLLVGFATDPGNE